MSRFAVAVLPEQSYLHDCFMYDQGSGVLFWRVRPLSHFKNAHGMNTFNSKHSGRVAGHAKPGWYVLVSINARHYLSHRVIWKFMTGDDPSVNIDHKDTNKLNNRWTNLRLATQQQNGFNAPLQSRNKTGFKGVSVDNMRGGFYACIRVNGKTKSLGRWPTAEAAHSAYRAASELFHGEFSNP